MTAGQAARAARVRPGGTAMRWNLRLAAANRGIWKASELQRMLASTAVISAGKMSGLWSGNPAASSCPTWTSSAPSWTAASGSC